MKVEEIMLGAGPNITPEIFNRPSVAGAFLQTAS